MLLPALVRAADRQTGLLGARVVVSMGTAAEVSHAGTARPQGTGLGTGQGTASA